MSIAKLTYGETARTTVDGSCKLYHSHVEPRNHWTSTPGADAIVTSGDDIPIVLLSTVELMAGFLAACVPTYRPIYRRLRRNEAQCSTDASNPNYRYHFEQSKNPVNITGGRGNVPLSGFGIIVTNQVEMSIHTNHRDEWMWGSYQTDDDQHRLTTKYGQARPFQH